MALLWIALFFLGACVLLTLPFLLCWDFYTRYRGSRPVVCPENHQLVTVAFDAKRASITRLTGTPVLRIAECTRWPERASCDRDCMAAAQGTPPFVESEFIPPRSKPIYHLPVLVAAFTAWVLGAVWHSQYLFRARWMAALGLSRSDVHQMVWRLAPHLLSIGIPLLFGYGVAWLLVVTKTKGVQAGVVAGVFLWIAITGTTLASMDGVALSRDLFGMELSYTFLASATIGAIVGGLSGKLVERTFAA